MYVLFCRPFASSFVRVSASRMSRMATCQTVSDSKNIRAVRVELTKNPQAQSSDSLRAKREGRSPVSLHDFTLLIDIFHNSDS